MHSLCTSWNCPTLPQDRPAGTAGPYVAKSAAFKADGRDHAVSLSFELLTAVSRMAALIPDGAHAIDDERPVRARRGSEMTRWADE